jgi:ABC-type transport system substrate-binding protein
MSWTFFLRKGVTFHDRTPFNAEAAMPCCAAAQEAPMIRPVEDGCREGVPFALIQDIRDREVNRF